MQELNEGTPKENKKTNGKVVGGIIAGVAVLGVGVGILAFNMQDSSVFKKLKGTPEEIVNAAILNTNAKTLEEQNEVRNKMGITQLSKIQASGASELNFDLGLQGVSGMEDADLISAYIKDAGLTGTFQKTKDNNKFNGKLSVNQSGIELLSASLYKDGEELGVSIPKILDAPYAIKLDSFIEDYKNSELFKLTGNQEISEEDFNELTEILSASSEYVTGAMNLASNKQFMSKTEAVQADFLKDANLKENGKKKVVLQDGSEVDWNVYSGTVTGKQVMEFFNKELDLIMELDFAKNYFDIAAKQSGYTVDELRSEMDEILVADDTVSIDMDIFVDENYFRGAHFGIEKNEEAIADVTIQYTGVQYLLDGMEISLGDSNEELEIGCTLSQNLGNKEDLFKQHLEISMSECGNSTGKLYYDYSYDSKAKDDNLTVEFGLDFGDEGGLNFGATGTKMISNDEVSTKLSKASLNFADDADKISVDFTLGYGIKAIKEADINIDKTGVKYLFEMTQEELIKAAQAIETNAQAFALKNLNMFM